MRFYSIIFSLIFFYSCKTDKNYQILGDERSKIDISTNDFLTSYGIYALDHESLPSEQKFDSLIRIMLPNYKEYTLRNARRSEPGYYKEVIEELSGVLKPPSLDYLKAFGKNLAPAEKVTLQSCKRILAITFYGGNQNINTEQRKIHKFLAALNKDSDHIIADFVTLEYFNDDTWNKRRVKYFEDTKANVADQILIKMKKIDSSRCRAVTFGMEKFCLPDISIRQFSCQESKKYTDVLLLVAQALSEKRAVSQDSILLIQPKELKNEKWNHYFSEINPAKEFSIQLKNTNPQIGDKNNLQLEIRSDSITKLVHTIFDTKRHLQYVYHDDKILEISDLAKKELPTLKQAFNMDRLVDDYLLIKAPIITNDSNKEWMWVKVLRWEKQIIEGSLYNTSSRNAHLKEGVVVSVDEKDVFDFIIKNEKGEFIGNETEKYLLSQKEKQ